MQYLVTMVSQLVCSAAIRIMSNKLEMDKKMFQTILIDTFGIQKCVPKWCRCFLAQKQKNHLVNACQDILQQPKADNELPGKYVFKTERDT